MRIYNRFPEAFDEISRDLKEMGVEIKTRTMQDKIIEGDPDYDTIELQNYIYTVTDPRLKDLKPTQPWADAEWEERHGGAILGHRVNPGKAWRHRPEVWKEFLHRHKDGDRIEEKFSYTYPDRLGEWRQVWNVIGALQQDPSSRQGYVSMWRAEDSAKLGHQRVPCSLGWLFQVRPAARRRGALENSLDLTYFMRSCDFATHFQNDIWLGCKLQEFIAQELNIPIGKFTQYMGSLHVYRKDLPETF